MWWSLVMLVLYNCLPCFCKCFGLCNCIYRYNVRLGVLIYLFLFFRKALKEISVGDLQPDETVDAMREARLLSRLDHPSIVKFHDSFIDGGYFCIITEYCNVSEM